MESVRAEIRGWDEKAKVGNFYTYRVIHLPDLKKLFELLYNHVADVQPREAMADQILIVVPREKSGAGFYIINSWSGLPGGGTSTCDYLLRYQG